MITLNESNFESEVIKSQKPVIVDFWAPWCGPCISMAPVFEELSRDYGNRLKFAKLNVDDEPGIASAYVITSIPTLIVFNKGSAIDSIVGFKRKDSLKSLLDNILEKI
jgi:thioredoxin 1